MANPNPTAPSNNSAQDVDGVRMDEKISKVGQTFAADLAQGKSPDPSTQSALEDTILLQNTPKVNQVPPPPPPPIAPLTNETVPTMPPQMPPSVPPPSAPISPSPRKKSGLVAIMIAIFGIAAIIGVAIVTGLMSKIVPGFGAVTITYWGLWEQDTIIRPILDEFEKTHPGTKVVYSYQSPLEYRERLQSAISQNKGPDVFRIHNTWVPMFRQVLAPVPSDVYSAADYQKTFYPAAVNDFRLGNNFVAIPLEIDGIAMYINDDLLQKSGQSVPQNWDQLRDAAIAMSKCDNQTGDCTLGGKILVSGAALGSTQNVDHWEDVIAALMLQNNVNLSNPAVPSAQAATDVLAYFSSFVGTYHMWDPNLPNSTTNFALGKVGIYFGPSWRTFDILAINPNLRFSTHPIPQLVVDPLKGETPVTYASYWGEAVNKNSPNAKQAWELLKYLSSSDIMPKLYSQSTLVGPNRPFGEPYSRVDLAESIKNEKYVGTFINQAPLAKSWYLTSFTRDGASGLNSRISDIFAKAVSHTLSVASLATEINKVLSEYGISASAPY